MTSEVVYNVQGRAIGYAQFARNSNQGEMIMYDALTDDAAAIAQKVDHMVRVGRDSEVRFHRCRNAAGQLAGAVYAFVEDPEGVGTDALRAVYQTFMQQDAGNFSSDPEPALTHG